MNNPSNDYTLELLTRQYKRAKRKERLLLGVVLTWLVLFVILSLSSCTGGPSVTRTSGGGYHATTGFTLAAKRENVVAEVVTREGDVLRFSTTNEDSTEVPTTFTWWWGTAKLAKINQPAMLKATDDPDVIPKDPNVIPKDPNVIPLDPNKIPQ